MIRSRSSRLALLVAFLAAVAGLAGMAPAQAATGPTVVTFSITAGSLSISAPTSASASATIAPGAQATAHINTNQITDSTGSLLGWHVTATATDLSDGTHTIDRQNMVWTTTNLQTVSGSSTGVSVGLGGAFAHVLTVDTPVPVAAATLTNGAGTYTYDGTVVLTIPVGTAAGTYQTTITQSVA